MALIYEKRNNIAYITLNRPEVLNAMDPQAYQETYDALIDFRDDPDSRVAILTGTGRAFCAGGDLKVYAKRKAGAWVEGYWKPHQVAMRKLNFALLRIYKPIIAAVNGHCVAWGFVLLLGTDIRISVPHAKFGYLEVLRGLVGSGGGVERLMRQVPYAVAMRLLLSGNMITAEEAHRVGLINEIVSPEQLIPRAEAIAHELFEVPPLETKLAKEAALRGLQIPIASAQRMTEVQGFLYRATTTDPLEGPRAFVEKRKARFTGFGDPETK